MTIHIPWWLVSFLLGVLSLAALFGSAFILPPTQDKGLAGVSTVLLTVGWALAVAMGMARERARRKGD